MNVSRKNVIISMGALAATAAATGCGGSSGVAGSTRQGQRGLSSLSSGIRHGKAAFPIWKTDMKIARRSRLHTSAVRVIGGGDPGDPSDPPGPSGTPPTILWSNREGWTSFAYRNDSASSLYDDFGDLAMQTHGVLNADNTVTVQAVGASGSSVSCTLPPINTLAVNAWGDLNGYPYYFDATNNTGTMICNNVTYTFTQDASKNITIHSDDGEPDVVMPAEYMVIAEAGPRMIHTASFGCNAAGFGFGFFGTLVGASALVAILVGRGVGSMKVAAGAVGLEMAMYAGVKKACGIP